MVGLGGGASSSRVSGGSSSIAFSTSTCSATWLGQDLTEVIAELQGRLYYYTCQQGGQD